MTKFKKNLRRFVTGLPLLSILWASFQPMQRWGHQALVLFAILWFYVVVLTEIFGAGYLGR